MKKKLLEIVNHYKIRSQIKHMQTEIWELNEAITIAEKNYDEAKQTYLKKDREHIVEELADVRVMLNQIQLWYGISQEEIHKVMTYKANRQLERIKNEQSTTN